MYQKSVLFSNLFAELLSENRIASSSVQVELSHFLLSEIFLTNNFLSLFKLKLKRNYLRVFLRIGSLIFSDFLHEVYRC